MMSCALTHALIKKNSLGFWIARDAISELLCLIILTELWPTPKSTIILFNLRIADIVIILFMIKPNTALVNLTFSLNPSISLSITTSQPKSIQTDLQLIKRSCQPRRNRQIKECGSTTGHCWFHKHTKRMGACFDNFIIYCELLLKYQNLRCLNSRRSDSR